MFVYHLSIMTKYAVTLITFASEVVHTGTSSYLIACVENENSHNSEFTPNKFHLESSF